MTGKIILQGVSTQKDFELNVMALHNGVYILKLRNGLGLELISEKIIIRK